ncbi:MAG TPA: sugar ABC transporter permease [Actinomycetes bacterium]
MATVTAGGKPSATRRRPDRGRRREVAAGYLFAAPFLLLFLVFTIGPVLASFFMSFTDLKARDIRNPFAIELVGLDNYAQLLDDETFRKTVVNTAYFVGVGLPLTMGIALAVAVGLNSGITRFRTLFRTGYYLPVVTSIVAISVVWRFLLEPDSGIVNTLLGYVGIDGPSWLNTTATAMPSLIAMATWRNLGSLVVIFLAGLQLVPREMHEAASIDGAGAWGRFRHITLPMMRPTILFAGVVTMIGYLQFFEEPLIMTQGGPLDSTLSTAYYTYNQFGFGNYSYAAAMAYVLFLVVALATALLFKLLGSKD